MKRFAPAPCMEIAMPPFAITLPIAILAIASSASAWATCSSSLENRIHTTIVTVTAGRNENCKWRDSNPGDTLALGVSGIVVPAPRLPAKAQFSAYTVSSYAHGKVARPASCDSTALPCSEPVLLPVDVPIDRPQERYCQALNMSMALSATATCVFQHNY